MKNLFATLLCVSLGVSTVHADASDTFAAAEEVRKELPVGSNASFDKRLPPVLPGESIDGPGGKMKVWSSAGPVPAAPAPTAPVAAGSQGLELGNVGVVIDQRPIERKGSPSDNLETR